MPIEPMLADVREPVVVFNVGMRINRLARLRQWRSSAHRGDVAAAGGA